MNSRDQSSNGKLPQIVLISERTEYSGLVGSYCWGGICVDKTIPYLRSDLKQKIEIKNNSTIKFGVKNHSEPKEFSITFFSGPKIVLNESFKDQTTIKVPNGQYFLNVMASWDGEGDLSYVFFIDVK